MIKLTRISGAAVAALGLTIGLAGCQEDNEKAALDSGPAGVTPETAPTTSQDAYNKQAGSDPMQSAPNYPRPR